MPAKYICPKCGRRFTAWGAEKVGFKCPNDEWTAQEHSGDVELVPVGSSDEKSSKKASLKRTPRRLAAIGTSTFADEELAESTLDSDESYRKVDTDFEAEEDEETEEEEEVTEPAFEGEIAVEVVEPEAESTDAVGDEEFDVGEVDEGEIGEVEETDEWSE
ncbi:MAG: hypothetical protein AMXMBFR84_33620 [Candidatus Hydrogenedentota bacterium]